MKTKNFERETPMLKALEIFDLEIEKINLFSRFAYINNSSYTSTCFLTNSDGEIVDIGHGKGVGLQSELSAKYEALEHYLCTKGSRLKDEYSFFSRKEIENDLSYANRILLNQFYVKDENSNKKTAWVELKNVMGNKSIFLPYFLINPDYFLSPFQFDELNYMSIPVKSTNNGIAIGATFNEAILHSINELIERDALSCFLLAIFGKKKPSNIKVMVKESLPDCLITLVNEIEGTLKEEIIVIDITSDLGFPAYCATFTRQNQLIQPMGFGVSLIKSYAIERAILEALQMFHLYNDDLISEDNCILNNFKNWPVLYKCARCDIRSLPKICFKEEIFDETEIKATNTADLLKLTFDMLFKWQFDVFFVNHYLSDSGITCIKAIIPGLELFYHVRYGHFVLPTERGVSILKDSK